MKEGRPSHGPESRSWLERLSQALLIEPRDRGELIELLRDAEERNLLEADSLAMIEGVMQVSEMQVRDIMIPRSKMVVVHRDESPQQYLPILLESRHSRFPVVGDTRDEIVGILLAKDLLGYFAQEDKDSFDIRDLLRPAVFIPESKRLNVLLREFRLNRNHMAIVVDEYGGISGLITIEDVLEQIVGDIADEYDIDEDTNIMQHGSVYTVKALTPVDDFNEFFSAHLSEEEFDTVGGLVTHALGHLPKRGESVDLQGFRFKVLRADNRRVHLLQVSLVSTPSTGDGEH